MNNSQLHAYCLEWVRWTETRPAFSLFYIAQAPNVKREADKLGIARSTYYRRVQAFARKAYSMSISIKRVH